MLGSSRHPTCRSVTTWCSSRRMASDQRPATAINLRSGVQIRVDLVLSPAGVTESVAVSASALDSSAITNTTALSREAGQGAAGDRRRQQARHHRASWRTSPASPAARPSTRAPTAPTSARPRSSSTAAAASQTISRGSLAENGPSLEQVGEFSVVSNGFNAEYGGFGIWFSNVTIKSGTNKFSGSVFDHYGTDALNARTFFQAEKTDYKQHEGRLHAGRARGPAGLRRPQQDVLLRQPGHLLLTRRVVAATSSPCRPKRSRRVTSAASSTPRDGRSRSSIRRRRARTATAASSAISFPATSFPPIASARARAKSSATCRRPICPATSATSATAAPRRGRTTTSTRRSRRSITT